MKTYTLPITADYVPDWGVWEVVRELLQNAKDQEVVNPKSVHHYHYDPEHNILTVGNMNCPPIPPQALLLGYSDKRDKDGLIGRHGEGFKLALLAALRLGCNVVVENGPNRWEPRLGADPQFNGVEVLQIDESEDADAGVVLFHLVLPEGVTDLDYRDKVLLDGAGLLLSDPAQQGRVYVNGLYVSSVKGLQYGYNFPPSRLKLDRDRRAVSDFDVSWEISSYWANGGDPQLRYQLLQQDKKDVSYILSEDIVVQSVRSFYDEEFGCAIPVSEQAEIAKAQKSGKKWTLVPRKLKELLWAAKEYFFGDGVGPAERLEGFLKRNQHRLPEEEVEELREILQQIKEQDEEVPF